MDIKAQVNVVLNAIMETLAEEPFIPASFPGLAAE